MKSERWQHIEKVYHAALEHQPESRDAFLDEACAGDETFRREVAALIACDSQAASFIEKPALEIAAKALADGSQVHAASSPAIPPIASQLGAYRLLALLGSGGMGVVYRARDERLGRDVALKILPNTFAKDPERVARFEREARAVASLNHPHICVLHDIGNQNGTGYMVMEHLEGETLAARISRGALPFDQALQLATQIADALDRAHRAGVTHRDVKPANLMLTRDGVKVLDFGLAKSGSKPAPAEQTFTAPLTTEGSVLGTPQYMAPEQFEGKEADTRSDIWAFGAVLYEMVTGEKAFQGKSYSSLAGAILSADPQPMLVKPFTPPALERLVRRCLAKEPEDRYQSMRDVVLDLRMAPQETAAMPARTSRWPWAVAAGVSGGCGTGSGMGSVDAEGERTAVAGGSHR